MQEKQTYQDVSSELNSVKQELTETRYQLEEANDTLAAIRSGNIDALIVKSAEGHQLYTLKTADQSYRIFIEQMTEGAITLSHSSNILYCNSQFAELVNYPIEKILGQPFCHFIASVHHGDCDALVEKAWIHSARGELNLLTSDKKEIPVLLSLKTLDLDGGTSLSIILTDLTSQKEVQTLLEEKNKELENAHRVTFELNANLEKTVKERTQTLLETVIEKTKVQERLTQILETMAEGVVIIDRSGNLTYANPMAQKILGLEQTEKNAQAYFDPRWQHLRLDGSALPDLEHPMQVTMNMGASVYDQEIAIQPPHKERFYISINAAPIRDSDGAIVAVIGTFMDVTNRRKAIQQKDDFISVASHELRTPIATLKASLQLLDRIKQNPYADMLPTLVDQSNKSLKKLTILINDLLNVSRMADGQLELNRSRFVMADVIKESLDNIHPDWTNHIRVEGNQQLEVYADLDRIEQVLINIINNAIKYAPHSKDILICISQPGNTARVEVADKGPGIPKEKQPYLFDRFYRVDDKGNQYSGFGLGLYICAEIIRKHGGETGVDSEIGKGSTFWFSLPLPEAERHKT